jgi:recombination protein RecA
LVILPFDLATGGGIPLNRVTIIYGPESSGKTNLALEAVAAYQKRYPKKICVYIDVEQALTSEWVTAMGVDVKKLAHIRPTHGEAVVDLVNELLYADDCGLVVIDSIAAIVTMPELEKDAENQTPGMQGRIVAKLVRKCTAAFGDAQREGRVPTMIWINQTRMKIGVVFGNPETMPGGQGQQFMAALRVRLSGKNIVEKSVNKAMPVIKQTSMVIQKWKQPINFTHTKFLLAMIAHRGLEVGECLDWNCMKTYLTAYGLMEKAGGDYVYTPTGESWGTHLAMWEGLRERRDEIRELLLEKLKENPGAADTEEED